MPLYNPQVNELPASVDATEVGYLDGVTSAIQTQLGTKLGGSTGATDEVLLRADGTGGKTAQASTVTLGDTGAITNQLTADVVGLTLRANTGGQTNKVFKIYRSNGDEVYSIDNNGSTISGGDLTINNIRTSAFTNMDFGSGALVPGWWLTGTSGSTNFLSMFKIAVNKAANRGLIVQGAETQTANLIEARDSTDAVLSGVDSSGNLFAGKLRNPTNIIVETDDVENTTSGTITQYTGDSTNQDSGGMFYQTGAAGNSNTGGYHWVVGTSGTNSPGDFRFEAQTFGNRFTLAESRFAVLQTTKPSGAAHANAGTGATIEVADNSSDNAGKITLTAGTTTSAGQQASITFHRSYQNNCFILLTPANGSAAGIVDSIYIASDSSGFIVHSTSALNDEDVYIWHYHVIGA